MKRSRKGSALLVVLGLMAIISISAFAFAAYMRYSRTPSSYTRRTSAARNLVKAALTRAIDAIDMSVNDRPHPNITMPDMQAPYYEKGEEASDKSIKDINVWMDRLFVGEEDKYPAREGDTVSPLAFEALAYIPPYLVNTVRWYSRRVPSAKWKTLDYDLGRYVYCAMDISDYLDVNRLFADAPRSSAPHTRFSLSYLFDSDGEDGKSYKSGTHKYPGLKTGEWDTWMEEYRKVDEKTREISWGSKVPFISLADFNMALGKKGCIEPFISPFCEFVGNNLNAFDNTTYAKGESTYADLRRMTLATDGLFPRHDTVPGHPDVNAHDLNDAKNQPFKMDYLKKEDPSLSESVIGTEVETAFRDSANGYDRLSGLGCAALRDYLDIDHIPLSLAIPTTERVPMICGVETTLSLDDASPVTLETDPEDVLGSGDPKVVSSENEGDSREVEMTLNFRFSQKLANDISLGHINVLTVFPFSHADESDTADFGLDGRLSFFLAVDGNAPLRPVGTPKDPPVYGPHLEKKEIEPTSVEPGAGIINVKLECSDKISVKDRKYPIVEEEDTLMSRDIYMSKDKGALESAFKAPGSEILTVTLHWNQSKDEYGRWSPSAASVIGSLARGESEYLSDVRNAKYGFRAIKWDGNGQCEGVVESPESLNNYLAGAGDSSVEMMGALWLRIKESKDDKVVDMVPACFDDDAVHLGGGSSEPGMKDVADSSLGRAYPLMLLKTGFKFDLSIAGLLKACGFRDGFKLSPRTIYVSDPRYNHAPEHWFVAEGDLSKKGWLAQNRSWLGGKDNDIFMATSDSGYMQSKYELMFIPRFTDLKNGGGPTGWYQAPILRHSIPETFDDTCNRSLVWKTYCPFPGVFPPEVFPDKDIKERSDNDDYAAFDSLPWTNDGSSFIMTPYSDNLNAFSSVFANTPIDWKRSSTNEVDEAPYYFKMTAKEFNSKYAYNEWTGEGKLAWEDVQSIARRYMGLVRRDGELRGDWKQAWQDMDWFGGNDKLCGIELAGSGRFWTADKKFLYGFWRDCIDPKQQLYLIFVRAEPIMVGVGNLREMPPQLGARAVGLVWRDPAKTNVDNGYPHRTRLLFYRQFE